ncbi:LON peptidase substrate-binding domain-containing protein [Malacoplasma iowae]
MANLLITRGIVIYPDTSELIDVGRDISINAIEDHIKNKTNIIVVSQKNPSIPTPPPPDVYKRQHWSSVLPFYFSNNCQPCFSFH